MIFLRRVIHYTHRLTGMIACVCLMACDSNSTDSDAISDTSDQGADAQMLALPDVDAGPVLETVCETIETERCDGKDNDCDDKIDEDFSIGEQCIVEIPDCRSEGTWVCGADEIKAVCDAPPFPEEAETCDGVDNDCDGEVDEVFDLTADPENCGMCDKVCAFDNARTDCARSACVLISCEPGWVDQNGTDSDGCECRLSNDSTEACDGLDNDCDGQTDEDFQLGIACTTGIGACITDGLTVCGEDKEPTCDAEPSEPGMERCNGVDDDCDGSIDEDFDADGDGFIVCPDLDCENCPDDVDCDAVCRRQDCADDDEQTYPSAPEICGDGIDQNCDQQDAVCEVHLGRVETFGLVRANEDGCRDIDGDGEPNNAFSSLSGVLNALLERDFNEGRINLIAMFYGLASSDGDFLFDFGLGYAVNDRLTAASLGADGRPSVLFPSARLNQGQLTAGPRDTDIPLPVPGALAVITATDALITGTVTLPFEDEDTGAVGVRVTEGLITAVVDEAELRATVEEFEPSLLPFVNAIGPDLDIDGDGVNDALSLCARFTVKPPVRPIENIPPPLGDARARHSTHAVGIFGLDLRATMGSYARSVDVRKTTTMKTILGIYLLSIIPATASAFCGFFVSEADSKLYNSASQVALMRKGTRTVMSMSNNYQGPPEDFAMVIPVPVILKKEM